MYVDLSDIEFIVDGERRRRGCSQQQRQEQAASQRQIDEHEGAVGTQPCIVIVWDRMPRAQVRNHAWSERVGSR